MHKKKQKKKEKKHSQYTSQQQFMCRRKKSLVQYCSSDLRDCRWRRRHRRCQRHCYSRESSAPAGRTSTPAAGARAWRRAAETGRRGTAAARRTAACRPPATGRSCCGTTPPEASLLRHRQVCVQPRLSDDDVTLPAFAAEHRRLLSIDISCPRRAQQQTATRCCCCRSTGQTDGRADGRTEARPFHRPCSATMRAVSITQQKIN